MVELEGRTICNLVGWFGMRSCRKEYITAFLICDFLFSYSLPHLVVFSMYTCNLHWFIFIPVLFTFVLDFSEQFDGGSFAKLFVGSVPRTATEEDVSQSIHIPKKKKKNGCYAIFALLSCYCFMLLMSCLFWCQIRPLFEDHGNVIEVALIKDKRTGQQQGMCRC